MAYSEKARELRRCTATCKDGRPCTRYAAWGDPLHRCGTHGGRRRRERLETNAAAYDPCHCAAYAWPHRPGGGLCRWPDPPAATCPTPAHSHRWPRLRYHDPLRDLFRSWRRQQRLLRRMWQERASGMSS